MSSRFLRLVGLLAIAASFASAQAPLRICADPDNLPFSNRAGAGFDNRIAVMVTHELHRVPVFVWVRSRRSFMREQFNKNACDVLLSAPVGMRSIAVSIPYYTSSYVFVTRAKEHLQIASFNDSHLNNRRIGLQILEEDLSPPSLPLIRTGHAAQLVGFESFGSREGDVISAVASGRVGVAVVWGPVAGYFARRSPNPLTLTPVTSTPDPSGIPFTYQIGFGVHKKDSALLAQMNTAIARLQPRILRVLREYSVPALSTKEGR
jgi:mxaJ protein